jgi:hypothetical protein
LAIGRGPVNTRAIAKSMVYLIAPHYQRKRFFRPRRRVSVFGTAWRTMRRYQVLELLMLTGAIALVWVGAQVDNQSGSWNAPAPAGVESARADLITGVPVGSRQGQRPL